MNTQTLDKSPAAERRIDVFDPARGVVIGSVPVLDGDAVGELARAARAAQPAWAAAGFKHRAGVFDAARRWLLANGDRMIEQISSETGKVYEDAQLEVGVAAQSFAFWARNGERYLADETIRSLSPMTLGKKVTVRHEPLGLVGVIGPWNYPLVNAFCDAVPALMAGNAVILKPSEVTPLTALLVTEMLDGGRHARRTFSPSRPATAAPAPPSSTPPTT